ncbi:MAG: hypothetical protein IJ371_04760 [Clostridia bacterium]|nr:hypothetical protein [Clostridia bacterium]
MEKTKKTTKQPAKKAVKKVEPAKATPAKVKATKETKAPAKVEKVQVVETKEVAPVKSAKEAVVSEPVKKSKVTFNQDLNILIGLFSLLTIIAYSFAFQGGSVEISGWELFLDAGSISGVFKGVMVLYVVSLIIDSVLIIRVDCEKEIFNIVEKILYMITLVINFVLIAVLLTVVSKIGIGLIIFLIISIINAIVKLARIFA